MKSYRIKDIDKKVIFIKNFRDIVNSSLKDSKAIADRLFDLQSEYHVLSRYDIENAIHVFLASAFTPEQVETVIYDLFLEVDGSSAKKQTPATRRIASAEPPVATMDQNCIESVLVRMKNQLNKSGRFLEEAKMDRLITLSKNLSLNSMVIK